MSEHRVKSREVRRMPPFTTLELLQAEHRRRKEAYDDGVPEKMTQEKWREHLAVVLRPKFGGGK